MKELTGQSALSPDDVMRAFREVITEQDVKSLARTVVDNAIEEGSSQALSFLLNTLFPKDKSGVEDTRWKRYVFCTWDQYNEVQTLKKRIADLEAELASVPKRDSVEAIEASSEATTRLAELLKRYLEERPDDRGTDLQIEVEATLREFGHA